MTWSKEGIFRYYDERGSSCTYTDRSSSCTRKIVLYERSDRAGEEYTYTIETSFNSEAQAAEFKKKLEFAFSRLEVRYDYLSEKTVVLTISDNYRYPSAYLSFPKYLGVLFEDRNVWGIADKLCHDLNVDPSAPAILLAYEKVNKKVETHTSLPAQPEEKTTVPAKQKLTSEQLSTLLKIYSFLSANPDIYKNLLRTEASASQPTSRGPAVAPMD